MDRHREPDLRIVIEGLPDGGIQDFHFQCRGVDFNEYHLTRLLTMLLDRVGYATGHAMTAEETLALVGLMLSRLKDGDAELYALLADRAPEHTLVHSADPDDPGA